MNIDELRNNKLIADSVKLIIDDKVFMNKCEVNFNKIFEDGKIDGDDIPLIINLILTVYKNHNKIKISKDKLKDVFILLIMTLIDKFKDKSPIDTDTIMMLLEPQIDLLFMSVKLPKMSCCGSKPVEDEGNVVNKLKLNKLEKTKKKVQLIPESIIIKEKISED